MQRTFYFAQYSKSFQNHSCCWLWKIWNSFLQLKIGFIWKLKCWPIWNYVRMVPLLSYMGTVATRTYPSYLVKKIHPSIKSFKLKRGNCYLVKNLPMFDPFKKYQALVDTLNFTIKHKMWMVLKNITVLCLSRSQYGFFTWMHFFIFKRICWVACSSEIVAEILKPPKKIFSWCNLLIFGQFENHDWTFYLECFFAFVYENLCKIVLLE